MAWEEVAATSMQTAEGCRGIVLRLDVMECRLEQGSLHVVMKRQDAHPWDTATIRTPCQEGPTTDSAPNRREHKTEDVLDGERICPKCSASNAERWVILPTHVPTQHFQAIVEASSVAQEANNVKEIDRDHTSRRSYRSFHLFTIVQHIQLYFYSFAHTI